VVGENGSGKCVCINTPIRIQNKKTGDIIETTIGELYAQEKQNNKREN
jgi:ABC-type dipeptide/oligopeptide/nickel transport system ATPase component